MHLSPLSLLNWKIQMECPREEVGEAVDGWILVCRLLVAVLGIPELCLGSLNK